MGTRRKSRELVLQMLFQADMGKQAADAVRKTFWAEREDIDPEARGFAEDLFRVACDRMEQIDELIGRHARHWKMDRMPAAIASLAKELLEQEATGDRARTEKWFKKYAVMPPELSASLSKANDIPVDIDPEFDFHPPLR